MPKIMFVKKTRADQGNCEKCGKPIMKGDPYKYITLRTGPSSSMKKSRCMECSLWRESEMTLSKMSGVYAAQEGFFDATREWTGDFEDMKSALEEAASQIEGVAEEYEESASNIEDGFGHATSMSEELEEKASELNDWAQTVRDALDNAPEYDAESYESMEDWTDEIRDIAEEAINDCPL